MGFALTLLSAHPEMVFSESRSSLTGPISALCSKFYPRNISYMPAVKFIACLELERKSSFLDGHQLGNSIDIDYRLNLTDNSKGEGGS
jgi:hypothetical protein